MKKCDSHGLQLLVMNIIITPSFEELKKSASQRVSHLKH